MMETVRCHECAYPVTRPQGCSSLCGFGHKVPATDEVALAVLRALKHDRPDMFA